MSDNKHNDPLESFFRKKAGEYNIQYREEDWLKLEDRLDAADNQTGRQNFRRLAAAAVILLFSVLAYITYQQQIKINQLSEQLNESENIANLPDNLPAILPDQLEQENAIENQEELSQVNNQNTRSDQIADNETPVSASDQQSDSPSNINIADERESEAFASQAGDQTIPFVDIKENNLAVISAKASPGDDGRSPAISAITPPKFNASRSFGATTRDHSSTFSDRPVLGGTSRLSLGLLLGPDMSTVGGLSNFSEPGHKIGMTVEYKLSKNLALSVGAIRSKVRYSASSNEYNPPHNYWTYGITPDHTSGECILIDIPVSLKYDFLHFHNSRVYASAGASSYIMLDEDYRFSYENNPSGAQQRWHERTGTRHWMSNATLSVGYEMDLSPAFSIRAEPFLRVPLQEVGWGKVKLYSVGSFISLNYNFH